MPPVTVMTSLLKAGILSTCALVHLYYIKLTRKHLMQRAGDKAKTAVYHESS